MRPILLLFFFLFQYIGAQNLPLRSLQDLATLDYKYYSYGSDGFCGGCTYFFEDSTVFMSGGCEGREHVSFGRWRLIGDSVEVRQSNEPAKCLVKHISWSAQDSGDSTTFVVTGMGGYGVERFSFYGLCKDVDYGRVKGPFGGLYYFYANHEAPSYRTWDSNTVKIFTKDMDSLALPKLELLSRQSYKMGTEKLPDTVYIQLALPASTLYYDELYLEEIEKPFRLKIIYKDAQKRDWDIEIKDEPKVGDE